MSNDRHSKDQKDQAVSTGCAIVGAHLLWSVVGPLVSGILLFGIVQSGSGWLSGFDLGLLFMVVLMLCARWIEQQSGHGRTAYGESSTWADFRRYALIVSVLAGVAWIVANVIGNHL